MIEKSLKLIITFQTTTAAIAMEKICLSNKLPGRLIPLPREIDSSCGMAWCAPPENRKELEQIAKEKEIKISGVYQLYF
ncbi:MAG: DUF3343 domain-containing protein [Eubacteriales bacterium]